jgi:ubiquinone/menaquinone biosynthesis C-methylase UbiE
MEEKIEILSVSQLEREKSTVDELKGLAQSLRIEFGWHYLLDLTWIIHQLKAFDGIRIIDAGAGTGIMQWYLADRGARVISIDRESRANLPIRFRQRYRVQGLRTSDLSDQVDRTSMKMKVVNFVDRLRFETKNLTEEKNEKQRGMVIIYNQDLEELVDLADDSIDAVVAVSSLEHNSPEDLEQVIVELMRVLKPGGVLLATLGAAKDKDWYHEPSNGWCYSEETIRRVFDISSEVSSNYDQYDQLFEALKDCSELKKNLASFYFRSGDNGMPWGKWNPRYQPVGICKFKPEK